MEYSARESARLGDKAGGVWNRDLKNLRRKLCNDCVFECSNSPRTSKTRSPIARLLNAMPELKSSRSAPIVLITATAPGTGKSYLVDVISTVATGHLCPVITASRNPEETEKRIGAVLLSGSTIVSLDNLTHDLESEILCHVAERPIVRVRILGRSEMPLCECRTALFATGNNVAFKGDMVRRGLLCPLEALEARPELHEYQHDVLARIHTERGKYVAATLTSVRAYLAAGSPKVCRPFGSYHRWNALVRSPLVWLDEPDRSTASKRSAGRTRRCRNSWSSSPCGRASCSSARPTRPRASSKFGRGGDAA